jgi:CTP:molybdopterin cytidylyltransferase MocA
VRTGAVITAAGRSSRMGVFKPLLKIGNLTAAEQVIRSFHAAGIRDIVLVTGNNAEELEKSLTHLSVVFLRKDIYECNEMFDSVKAGFNYLKDTCDRIFLTPVDIPLFTSDTVKLLLNSKANVGIPVFKKETGHPIILDNNSVKKILMYTGTGGLRDAIANLSLEIEYVETGDQGILLDMDTPADYRKIVQLHDRYNS